MPTAISFSIIQRKRPVIISAKALWQMVSAFSGNLTIWGSVNLSAAAGSFFSAGKSNCYDQGYPACAAWLPDFIFNTLMVRFHNMELLIIPSSTESNSKKSVYGKTKYD